MRISDWSSDVCSSDLGADQAVTVGSSIAFDSPCGTWKCAPTGRLIPCTSATELFEKAIPACVAPSIIAPRAAASIGSLHTRRRLGDRKSVVSGKSVSVRVDLGGPRRIKKKKNQ